MVRTDFLSASEIDVRQAGTLFPFRRTVQARHWPSPQPYFAPVSWNSSRRTSRRERSGSVESVCERPLMVSVKVEFMDAFPLFALNLVLTIAESATYISLALDGVVAQLVERLNGIQEVRG